jgi:hypothetical protein
LDQGKLGPITFLYERAYRGCNARLASDEFRAAYARLLGLFLSCRRCRDGLMLFSRQILNRSSFGPDLRFLAVTSFQSFSRPSLSFGSSSRISLSKHFLSVSRPRFRPPGNIQRRSRFRRTNRTRPRRVATSFDDFAMVSFQNDLPLQGYARRLGSSY